MKSHSEAVPRTDDVERLIERLENSPKEDRASAIEELSGIGDDTRAFLHEHFEATEMIDQACRRPGQRLQVHPVSRSEELRFDFELEEEIGRGATGSVWKAQDLRLRTTIAVKLFETLDARQRQARERVLREAQAASRVISNHVVRIRDVGELQDGTPFIAMELCAEVPDDGSSAGLRDIGLNLDRDPPRSLEEAVRLVSEAAKGVADAHREGVYHRDLKPANILCRPSARRAEIIDFGLAVPELLPGPQNQRRADQSVSVVIENRSGERIVLAGTPAFMAPEQCQGLPVTAANSDDRERLIRVDVYGLGATLYTLLAGHPPYRPRPDAGNDVLDVVAQVTGGPPPKLGTIQSRFPVPARLRRIVEKAMARNPAERFRSARELSEALRDFLDSRPTDLDRAVFTRLGLWLRRNRVLVRTGLGLVSLTAVFAAVWLVSYQRFVEQRQGLNGTVEVLEMRREALQSQNAVLTRENSELTEERDRLKNDFDILQAISQDLESMGKAVGRGQRRIRDNLVTPAGLQEQLLKTAGPLLERLARVESRMDQAVSQSQIDAIHDEIRSVQSRLLSFKKLANGLDQVQQTLPGLARTRDFETVFGALQELRLQIEKLQTRQPETTPPKPTPPAEPP